MTITTPHQEFIDVIRTRRSPRAFLAEPMPVEAIRGTLEDAQTAPSHSNTQPWVVHIVSGATRDRLSSQLLVALDSGRFSPDFNSDYGNGVHLARSQQHGATLYGALGIARNDHRRRDEVMRDNLRFYGAPHVALLFMPQLGDGIGVAGDIGMYAQNFLLSLTARGYHGIPQAVHGMFAGTVREVLGVPADLKLCFGISFGTADPESPASGIDVGRVPLQESVILHDTSVW